MIADKYAYFIIFSETIYHLENINTCLGIIIPAGKMHYDGEEYVSLLDFIETVCKKEAATSIASNFCTFLTSKYSYEGNKCFKAEGLDKTRHILLPIEIVLEIFVNENIKETIILESFNTKLNEVLSKNYIITGSTCCCCPKKMKKAVSHAASFTDFVRQGEVELRRFNSLKPTINLLVCLDIEAFERSVDKLLEFGLSVYDMSTKTTTNSHIIVTNHLHLRNGRYVADNRDKYNFGQSLFRPLDSALNQVLAVLMTPNSCLIGHNIKADISFLKGVSSKKLNMPIFDTQIMYKQATLSENMLGLVRVLDEIGIPHSNLHNAGNDAYYTLEVFKRLTQI